MKQLTTIKKMKGSIQSHPVSEPSKGYAENNLTPVTVSGVIATWNKSLNSSRTSDYKLMSYSGLQYFIVADNDWREVLSSYCWEDVKVIGLLNASNMTLIPQKVYPKGPTDEDVIDLASWKSKDLVKKMVKNVNDLVVIPTTVWAVMAA